MKKLKAFTISAPLAIIALIILIAVGGYLTYVIYQSKQVENLTTNTQQPTTNEQPSTPSITDNTVNNTTTSSDTSDTSDTSDSSDTSDTSDETTDWQSYTNREYDLSFEYPNDWKITSVKYPPQTSIELSSPIGGDTDLYLMVEKNSKVKDIDTYKEQMFANFDNFEKMTVAGETTLKVCTNPSSPNLNCTAVFYHNNVQYRLNIKPNADQADFNAFDQILSTFQFMK